MTIGKFASVKFACSKCGGIKLVGDDYFAFGESWVDVTCIKCSHSKDIKIKDLEKLLAKINQSKK